MQFGPQSLIPVFFAKAFNSFCIALPASPLSANPPASIITPFMPRSAQSFIIAGTFPPGTKMMARSTGSGTSVTDLKHFMPSISSYLGFTG